MTEQISDSLTLFGEVAAKVEDRTIRAGRYSYQKLAERRILGDLLPKLMLEPHHRVLDIGCGAGLLVVPLAQLVEEVIAVDHPLVLEALGKTINFPNITLLGGGFPGVNLSGRFDRIVAYSVMQTNRDFATALDFVRAAAGLLADEGRLIIADIPNSDRRARFRDSARGREFEEEWNRLKSGSELMVDEAVAHETLGYAEVLGQLSDAQVMEMAGSLRSDGFDVWIVPQARDLPFGNTREDMIIVRP